MVSRSTQDIIRAVCRRLECPPLLVHYTREGDGHSRIPETRYVVAAYTSLSEPLGVGAMLALCNDQQRVYWCAARRGYYGTWTLNNFPPTNDFLRAFNLADQGADFRYENLPFHRCSYVEAELFLSGKVFDFIGQMRNYSVRAITGSWSIG